MGCCCTKSSATADDPDKSHSESTDNPEAPQEPQEPQEQQEQDVPFPIVQIRTSTNPMTTTSEDSEADEGDEKWEADEDEDEEKWEAVEPV